MLTSASLKLVQIAATELFDALEDGELRERIEKASGFYSENEDFQAGVRAGLRLMLEQAAIISEKSSTTIINYENSREAALDDFQLDDFILDANGQAFSYTPSEHKHYPFPIVGFKKLPDPQYRQKVGMAAMEFPIKVYRSIL